MRNLSPQALELISSGEAFIFGFDITLNNQQHLYLTDYNSDIIINGAKYQNHSALHIKKANFNDSGHDFIEIEGIFQANGIDHSTNLDNATFDIILIFPKTQTTHLLFAMSFVSMQRAKLNFTLYLKNQTVKLEQNITKIFSKTCRAKLGDTECSININAFTDIIQISKIEHNNIITQKLNKPCGYYDYGKLEFLASNIQFLILKHDGALLRCEKNIPQELIHQKNAKITPACDKTIETCHGRFANAINFRGEPFIPTRL